VISRCSFYFFLLLALAFGQQQEQQTRKPAQLPQEFKLPPASAADSHLRPDFGSWVQGCCSQSDPNPTLYEFWVGKGGELTPRARYFRLGPGNGIAPRMGYAFLRSLDLAPANQDPGPLLTPYPAGYTQRFAFMPNLPPVHMGWQAGASSWLRGFKRNVLEEFWPETHSLRLRLLHR
jgi:hypothetical protein